MRKSFPKRKRTTAIPLLLTLSITVLLLTSLVIRFPAHGLAASISSPFRTATVNSSSRMVQDSPSKAAATSAGNQHSQRQSINSLYKYFFKDNPSSSKSIASLSSLMSPAVLDQLSRTSAPLGDPGFTLTLTGSNFVDGAVVNFGSTALNTTFVNDTSLTADVTANELNTSGTFDITVVNPGESASAPLTFAVVPVATLTSLSSTSAVIGSAGFQLTVTGSDFFDGAVVKFGATSLVTTFSSATSLTAAVTATQLQTAGVFPITVINPGVAASSSIDFTVNNPVPALSNLSPNNKLVGTAGFTLNITGTNFVTGASVDFGGTTHTADVVVSDSSHLSATIAASEITVAGAKGVTVTNPGPGGGTTATLNFTVNNPTPSITTISPTIGTRGGSGLTLTVTGSNFIDGAVVKFGSTSLSTTFASSTSLTADVAAAQLVTAGTFSITVANPAPAAADSNAVNFTVNPIATLTNISPTSAIQGGSAFTLTVTGTDFVNGAVVKFGSTSLTTTFGNSTSLTADVTTTELATVGTFPITVVNPGVAASNSVDFGVTNPPPTTTNLSPSSATTGDLAFTLTVNGTNFVSGATINFAGTSHPSTNFINSTQLTTQIAASEIASGGLKSVTVTNPAPGGGTSTPALTFTVNNPVPVTSNISPTSATAGDAPFTLTVNGSNFVSGATINFGATNHPSTTFVNSSQLTTQIATSEILVGGTVQVTVTNPTPAGGTSTPGLTFTINNPAPTLANISPTSKTAGDPAFTLTVNGANFNTSSVVQLGGSPRTTTFVNSTQVTAQIPATDIAVVGTPPITVVNPSPGGGTSSAVNLTVSTVPVPTITTLSPASVTAGAANFTLTVNGTNFVAGSVVRFNGSARTTTFVNSTQLTAAILATDIVNSGNVPITVLNPAPGGGTSNAVNLVVNPSITTISPPTVRAGDIAFTLTVNGTGFVTGTVVRFNGVNRSTTFVNSTRLTASILAADIASVGTYPITVLTPAPASLVSNAVNITAIPSLGNLSPMNAVVGGPAFTLTVTGSGFVNGSVVRWNGSNRTTTFVNNTKLTASITAADIATVAARPVTVLNPAPTNLSSNAINFNVTNPPPATECASGPDVVLSNPGLINSGPARSQMWRTDDNVWWGAFSNNTDGIYFYKRSTPTSWVQGPLIDANFVAGLFVAGAPDTLWTGTNLFVLVQESTTLAKLYKYTYTSATQTFTIVSGFPVNLPLTGVGTSSSGKTYGTLAIEQDSTGKLWAAYTGAGLGGDGTVRVISSTSADHRTWDTTGVVLETGISTLKTEGSTIVRFGNKIGVGWSNLNTNEDGFRFHTDGDPAATWSTKEVIDSGLGPEGTGGVSAKQMTMKAHPDGRIFLVADDNDGLNNHLHLYIRSIAGVWGNKTLVVNDFNAMPSKPVLLLDTDNSTVHVIYKDGALTTNGLSGQTFITQSSMTNPAFNPPCLFIDTSDDSVLSTSNPTSTKQTVNAVSDFMVAVSTGKTGNRILVNSVDLTPNALTIFTVSPKEATAGETTFTLTVNGKLFVSGATVRFAGVNRTTTFVNAGRVTASIPNTAIAAAGTYPVVVRNPGPVDSNSKDFIVTSTNPVPDLNLISPTRELVGSPQITMTLNGTGFRRTSVVRFNGVNKTTTYISDTQLTATIPASDFLVPGPYPVTVFNPTPGGGTSAVTKHTTFFVEPPCATPAPISFPGITLFNTNKAQMWYNDGFWWGAFSDNIGGVYFHKQNGTSAFTKGALIDGNFNGRPDVMWNGTNLFVLVYEFNTQAKFYKYTYNPATDVYTIVSGFPVTLPLIGIGTGTSASATGSITFAQDSTGKIWATYPGTGPNGDGNYRVIWTTSADHKTWDTNGFILATGGALATQEVTNIVHFGGNKIGIAWSHQLNPVEDAFRYHVDGDPENVWSTKEVIDSGLGNEVGIGGVADNHGSMRAAPDGRIFLVAKDSDDVGYLHLYVRSAAGVWGPPVLVDIDPHAQTTRPSLALDLENSEVYVLYADASTSLMYLGHTSMDTPNFGPPCPYVTQAAVSDSTTSKQNLRASMGFMGAGSSGGATSAIYINPITLATGSGNSPILTSLSPAAAGLNGPSFDLTVNGSNFASNAVVYVSGIDRPTTFVSSTQLKVRIFATDIAALGSLPVSVMNPKGGSSAAVNLIVGAAITSLVPDNILAGSAQFTLTVNGGGYVNGTTVNFNGVAQTTTFVNANQVTAQIPASSVATAGSYPVTVTNPGGSPSPPMNFTVNNPVPTLGSLFPTSAVAGAGGFTLTVNGTNFTSGAVVNFNGLARATTFVNSTQLTALILASDAALAGTFPITVSNPVPGGGTSNIQSLTVTNPVPGTMSLTPTTVLVGGGSFILTVNGTAFVNGAVVRVNGIDRATTFVTATQLTAQVLASDVLAVGSIPITVFNPLPGGGISNATILTVQNPVPVLTSILPASKTVGDAAFTLTANGSSFNSSSIVRLNGIDRATTFVSPTQLTAQIPATDLLSASSLSITVFNPAPGGGSSSASTLTVNNPVPTLTAIDPLATVAGAPAFTMNLTGTNFNNSSVVRFNGSARTTTFIDSTHLSAQITAADILATGDYPITVFNPTPGGGTSSASILSVSNEGPVLTGILPVSKNAGDTGFDLTIIGTGFNNSSVARVNGVNRTTTLVNNTQLTAQIPTSDLVAGGNLTITVFNPPPGGGISNQLTLPVNNLVPTLGTISPTSKTAGDPAFVLTVNGTNFNPSSIVRFNGSNRTTTFVSATQLTAQIPATDVAAGSSPSITVFNPAPGGGTSSGITLTVNNPAPTLTGIAPAAKQVGDVAFQLTVNGTNFNSSSVVRLGGSNRTTTLVSATQLTAQITAADLTSAGTFPITVLNPTPGGGTSTSIDLVVNNNIPTVTTISPNSKQAGDPAFVLTVSGTNFINGSVVRVGGSNRTTSFVSATQLTAQITASDIAGAATLQISAFNPAPGGGASSAVDLTVNNPVPTVTSLNPTGGTVGGPGFSLTVNGTGFVSNSTVRFNGSNRTTTFISSTQVSAQIQSGDLASQGDFPITVVNAAPGGGTSNAVNLNVAINNPQPTLSSITPSSTIAGSAALTLTVNGTGFVSNSVVQWNGQSRPTNLVSGTQLTAQITAADVAVAALVPVTIFNPTPGGGTSTATNFTVSINPRTLSIGNASGSANGTVTIPIQITAVGNEAAFGFSINFDPTLLTNPQVTLGSDVPGASLNGNANQANLGRYGIALALPTGQSLAPGARQIANVTFNTNSVVSQTVTPVSFGDQPIVREVANSLAEALPAAYSPGSVTISLGFEADVAPRPGGTNNGTISISDWVQLGRFSAGLDVPDAGSEFQRTDCAPRNTMGNGSITISDWVQAGRYASGFDPVLAAGGPTGPQPLGPTLNTVQAERNLSKSAITTAKANTASTLRLVSSGITNDSRVSISLEIDAQGNENAMSFSLMFDPTKYDFVSANTSEELRLATLQVNNLEVGEGRLGLALALPTGRTFGIGTHQVVVLTFELRKAAAETRLFTFADRPVKRELVDVNANVMNTRFEDLDSGLNPLEDPQFFVAQQYLDILNRAADAKELEYWTNQIQRCGSDVLCLNRQRIAVSSALFGSPEYQRTGYTIYLMYRAAFGRQPTRDEFLADRNQLIDGPQLAASTVEFARLFVQRPEFRQAYPETLTAREFSARLYRMAELRGLSAAQRKGVFALADKQQDRSQVLLDLIQNKTLRSREYESALTLVQYFVYLKREPDPASYEVWLSLLSSKKSAAYQQLFCSFINSQEYLKRFSVIVPNSAPGCGP